MMWGKSLEAIVAALKGMGRGYFVLRDDEDDQYVIMPMCEFERLSAPGPAEVQLPLPAAEQPGLSQADQRAKEESDEIFSQAAAALAAHEVLDRINREIALYQSGQQESGLDVFPVTEAAVQDEEPVKKVRFEPLRGDLPPELQE